MILEIDITKILNSTKITQATKHEIIEFLYSQTILSDNEYQDLVSHYIKYNEVQGFKLELCALLNKHCKENESNTPDFILAYYLSEVLEVFNKTIAAKNKYSD